MYVRCVPAFPCHDIVPCGLRYGIAILGLVEEVGGKGKVGDPGAVVLVDADVSDTSLELDPVDVIHKIFLSFFVVKLLLPHILCALGRLGQSKAKNAIAGHCTAVFS
jgi:hypothetical protein